MLFYSAADVMRWESLIEKSRGRGGEAGRSYRGVERTPGPHAAAGQRIAVPAIGRCRSISGQAYRAITAVRAMSAWERWKTLRIPRSSHRRFSHAWHGSIAPLRSGARHGRSARGEYRDDPACCLQTISLSTFGLLKDSDKKELTNLVHQLVDQEVLVRTPGTGRFFS